MKEKVLGKVAKLIDLKSIITFMVCVAMIGFTGAGIISGEMFIAVGTLTFQYYFNRKELNDVKDSKETNSSK